MNKGFRQIIEDEQQFQRVNLDACLEFYRKYVGTVEVVDQQSKLHKIYFQKPFMLEYINNYIQNDIINNAKLTTDEEKITHFNNQVQKYYRIMEHRQKLQPY